jgi:phosphate transport system substrate-binding protein
VVSAVPEAIQAAAAGADWAHAPGFYMILTDSPGAESWPIAGATFILIPKKPDDAAAAQEALKFFDWAYKNGSHMASELDYVPLPASLVGLIRKTWAESIKGPDGKPIYASTM